MYGCNFALGDNGLEAVNYIEASLGLSVAASDDVTGIDSDWELEVGEAKNVLSFDMYKYNLQGNCNLMDYTFCPPSSPTAMDGTITFTNLQTLFPGLIGELFVLYKSSECGLPNFSTVGIFQQPFPNTSNPSITRLKACKYDILLFTKNGVPLTTVCDGVSFGIDLGTVAPSFYFLI